MPTIRPFNAAVAAAAADRDANTAAPSAALTAAMPWQGVCSRRCYDIHRPHCRQSAQTSVASRRGVCRSLCARLLDFCIQLIAPHVGGSGQQRHDRHSDQGALAHRDPLFVFPSTCIWSSPYRHVGTFSPSRSDWVHARISRLMVIQMATSQLYKLGKYARPHSLLTRTGYQIWSSCRRRSASAIVSRAGIVPISSLSSVTRASKCRNPWLRSPIRARQRITPRCAFSR